MSIEERLDKIRLDIIVLTNELADSEQYAREQGAKHVFCKRDKQVYALLQAEHEVQKALEFERDERDVYTGRRNDNDRS